MYVKRCSINFQIAYMQIK